MKKYLLFFVAALACSCTKKEEINVSENLQDGTIWKMKVTSIYHFPGGYDTTVQDLEAFFEGDSIMKYREVSWPSGQFASCKWYLTSEPGIFRGSVQFVNLDGNFLIDEERFIVHPESTKEQFWNGNSFHILEDLKNCDVWLRK